MIYTTAETIPITSSTSTNMGYQYIINKPRQIFTMRKLKPFRKILGRGYFYRTHRMCFKDFRKLGKLIQVENYNGSCYDKRGLLWVESMFESDTIPEELFVI